MKPIEHPSYSNNYAPYNFEESTLIEIVESMFDEIKEPVSGIHIRMADGTICNILIYEGHNHDTVFIEIDGYKAGRFEKPENEHAGYQIDFIAQRNKMIASNKFEMVIAHIKSNQRINVY